MKKLFITFLALTISTQVSWGIIDEKKISLREAIEKALSTNPQMQMMNMDIEKAQNDIKKADRLQNPSIDLFQNIGETRRGNPQEVGASLLVEVLKRSKRKNLAKVDKDIVINKRDFSKYELVLDVRRAYIDLLLKKSNLKIMKQQRQIAQDLYNSMQLQVDAGVIPKTEALQAKISLNRAIMAQNTARADVIISQNKFNGIMNTSDINYDTKEEGLNIDYEGLLTISPLNDTLLNFDKIQKFALARRYDLQQAKNEVRAAENKLRMIKSNLVPDIEISSGYNYETKAQSESDKFMHGSFIQASIVNIPLFYQYKPEIKNAKIEIEEAQLAYKDKEIDAIRNITDAWENFVTTREVLNFYNKELLSNSQELMAASREALRKQEINFVEFLISKKTYFDLLLGYQKALAEYYISYAELLTEMNIIEVEKENI